MPGVTAWLAVPREDRGIHFACRDGGWDRWSYARLAELAGRFARELRGRGAGPDRTVALVLGTGPEIVAALFATVALGASAAPLPPPPLLGSPDWAARTSRMLDGARPAVVVTAARHAGSLPGRPVLLVEDVLASPAAPSPEPGEGHPHRAALTQFTSGSTGAPRGVRIPLGALTESVGSLGRWLDHTPERGTASWLPLHHDMGLVGCLISPVAHGADLWLLPTEEFVRRPLRYLSCFADGRASLSAMPAFGLAHIAARVRAADLEGWDLSGWRTLIVGAERIDGEVLERFERLLAPAGLPATALTPAYGLAEATLAVTGTAVTARWHRAPSAPGSRRGVVGCGRPLPGTTVTVVDETSRALPDGRVGEIAVRGPAVAGRPEDGARGGHTRWEGDTLHTGDAGFVVDGELYVIGRFGDSVKVRGQVLFAEDLELALDQGEGRPVVVLGARDDGPVALLVVAPRRAEAHDRLRARLRPLVGDLDVVVRPMAPAQVPRTSSGKPRRRELWRMFVEESDAARS